MLVSVLVYRQEAMGQFLCGDSFFFGSWFYFVGLITCIYLAYSWPKTKTIEDEQRMDVIMPEEIEGVSKLDDLESRIKRLIALMPQGLINDDECVKLRKKELVPD